MYRPTVRMDDLFKEWAGDMTGVSTLTVAQVFRLALVIGGESERFRDVVSQYLKEGEALPSPKWEGVEKWLWWDLEGEEKGRGEVNSGDVGTEGTSLSLGGGDDRRTLGNGTGTVQGIEERRIGETTRQPRKVRVRQAEPNGRDTNLTINFGDVARVGGTIKVLFD